MSGFPDCIDVDYSDGEVISGPTLEDLRSERF